MPKEKIKLESMRQLVDFLYESPFLSFRMRLGLGHVQGNLVFVGRHGPLLKFIDDHDRPFTLILRPDPRRYEWGLRFFRGGFRFQAHRCVTRFYFTDNPFPEAAT